MKIRKSLVSLFFAVFLAAGCSCARTGDDPSGSGSGGSSGQVDPEEKQTYMDGLKETSQADHFYYHYLRFQNDYNDLDTWVFPYKPNGGEGVKFDWVGRTQGTDPLKTASGNPVIDSLGYVSIDIDLHATYDGGWSAGSHVIGGKQTKFLPNDVINNEIQLGCQIVYTASRVSSSGFWQNDGGDVHIKLTDFELTNKDGSKSYHAFVYEDNVATPTKEPVVSSGNVDDPFKDDDGTNYTVGKEKYMDALSQAQKGLKDTSDTFLKTAGVGYQIMVSSFADSDGDGNGDIYGIELKLDYLKALGVKVLWLTPIQKSDSYHGYDISDYEQVDSKFGSKTSPAAVANGGVVSEETALQDYKSLLAKAHSDDYKMLVVMDLVLNHTSVTNKWFISSAKLDPATRGYYQWGNHVTSASTINENNYWYPYGSHDYSYYAKFGSSMPELNYAYTDTRTAIFHVADTWAELGVDGFRMDAVKHIFLKDELDQTKLGNDTIILDVSQKTEGGKTITQDYSSDLTKNLHFWRDLNDHVKSKYPNCFFVGENFDGHAYHVAPFYEGFDSLFDFYSYFNLTSIASYYYNASHSINTGSYVAKAASYVGHNPAADAMYSVGSDKDLQNGGTSVKYGNYWSQAGVFDTNNKYRTGGTSATNSSGFKMINGAFTSNHDIARTVNRVAGRKYDLNGLTDQGMVSTSNYNDYLNYAALVEINEIMLPGLTWIYYGDELGMTGNFDDPSMTGQSAYADLAYRQPMKWKQGAEVGDGSMTTGQDITGSKKTIKWDTVNASTSVVDAETQVKTDGSHYKTLARFANLKNSDQALINGNFSPYYGDINEGAQNSVVSFTRTLGSTSYRVVVNYGNNSVSISSGGDVVASYGNASATSVGARSAVVVKLSGGAPIDPPAGTGYGLKFGDGTTVQATATGGTDWQGRTEYKISGYDFKKDSTFMLYDYSNGATWVINIDEASFGGNTSQYVSKGSSYTVLKDFKADVYIKLSINVGDQIYFELK